MDAPSGWIPVAVDEPTLPADREEVLALLADRQVRSATYVVYPSGGHFDDGDGGEYHPTHWQPRLPDPEPL